MEQPVEELAPARVSMHRRTLLKGAAWTVPAVLLVGTTPAFAVSNDLSVALSMTAARAAKKVTYSLTITNPAPSGGTPIQGIGVSLDSVSPSWAVPPPAGTGFAAAVVLTSLNGQQSTTVTFTGYNPSTTNDTYSFNFTISYSIAGSPYSQQFTVAGGSVVSTGTWTRQLGGVAYSQAA